MEMEIMQEFWKLGATSHPRHPGITSREQTGRINNSLDDCLQIGKRGGKTNSKIGNANIFKAVWSKKSSIGSFVDDFLTLFGGFEAIRKYTQEQSGRGLKMTHDLMWPILGMGPFFVQGRLKCKILLTEKKTTREIHCANEYGVSFSYPIPTLLNYSTFFYFG